MVKNKKSKIPYIFFAFFAFFIIADLIFIYIAKTTWRGTVTENSYEKGRKYNQTILATKKQENLGWQANIQQKFIKDNTALITLNLLDKSNKFIDNAKIKIRFVRPTQTGFDFEDELFLDKINNNYQKAISFPLKGLWKIEIQAFQDENIFQYVQRIVID